MFMLPYLFIISCFIKFMITLLLFILLALPLYFAIKLVNGKANIFKIILVNIVSAIIFVTLASIASILGMVVAFMIMGWLYYEIFKIKVWKVPFVFLLHFLILFLFLLIFLLLFYLSPIFFYFIV